MICDALVVVDMQNDFVHGGSLPVKGGLSIIPAINALMRKFETVVFTADWHPIGHMSFASSHFGKSPYEKIDTPYGRQMLWPDHCVAGTYGAQFVSGLHIEKATAIIHKGMRRKVDSYSGFMEGDGSTFTGLAGYLRERGIRRVFVCGLATDFCVSYTAEDAQRAGFDTFVVTDASAAIDTNGSLAMAKERWKRADVVEISSEEVV